MKRRGGRSAVVAVTALAAVTGLTGTGHADSTGRNIGYGQPNVPQAVVCVQQFYNRYIEEGQGALIQVDGKFGRETDRAVRRIQSAVNTRFPGTELQVDGVVGPRTGHRMIQVLRDDWTIDRGYADRCAQFLPG
ncbi:peptidoglycan-binding protein [Kitasatospora sp. RG8]|uniref:peptidoglycan-binding domain-containing protein n=1 Tax=Kitasatospora sp. RG8 TaxID=2820815 RepID=UPI001ADECB10|nr:peptidoglycan-binding domain-containing protein [Kitasatospora sp. RG8]MBP0454892.1 peptidoglycan-binding protein [Kitasatospora sp. RG8]